MKFAGILENKVIAVINSTDLDYKFPNTNDGIEILTIPCDNTVQVGDVYENGKINGTYIEPYEPTNSELAQLISDLQADIEIMGVK